MSEKERVKQHPHRALRPQSPPVSANPGLLVHSVPNKVCPWRSWDTTLEASHESASQSITFQHCVIAWSPICSFFNGSVSVTTPGMYPEASSSTGSLSNLGVTKLSQIYNNYTVRWRKIIRIQRLGWGQSTVYGVRWFEFKLWFTTHSLISCVTLACFLNHL